MSAAVDIVLRGRNQTDPAFGAVNKNIKEVTASARSAVSSGLTPFNNALSTLAANVATAALGALAGAMRNVITASIGAASNAEETASAFAIAFGEAAGTAREELDKMAADMNRSKYEFAESALSFQSIFVPMGWARAEAAKMSTSMTALVSDVASFRNASESDVQTNFLSGIVGEHEALRKYGIVITEVSLKQELARLGTEGLTGAQLEQAKIQARLNLIYQATTDAQGDAVRTAGSYANTVRGVQAAIMDLRVGVGAAILPALTPFLGELVQMVKDIGPATIGFFTNMAEYLSSWAERIDLSSWITGFINGLLEAGNVLATFAAALMGQDFRDNSFVDLFEYLPEPLSNFLLGVLNVIYAVQDFAKWVWELLTPIREWIAENVTLTDFLIALGAGILYLIGGPVAAFLAGFAQIGLIVAGATLIVAALRTAWEEDFLGIRTEFEGLGAALLKAWQMIDYAFFTYGGEALGELVALVTGSGTEFSALTAILERVSFAIGTVFDFIWDAIKTVLDNMAVQFPLVGGFIKTAVMGISAIIGGLWDVIVKGKEPLGAWLIWFGRVRDMLGGPVAEVLLSFMKIIYDTRDAIMEWVNGQITLPEMLGKIWGSVVGEGQRLFTLLVDFAVTNLPIWKLRLSEWAMAAWTWIRDTAIPNTVTWLGSMWTTLSQWAINHLPAWITQLGIWATQAWVWIRDIAIPRTVQWLGTLWSRLSGWATTNLPKWISEFGQWARETWTWIKDEVIPNAWNQLGVLWLRFKRWSDTHLPKWTDQLFLWGEEAWIWIRDVAIPGVTDWLGFMWADYILPFLTKTLPLWAGQLALWAKEGWTWIRDDLIPNSMTQAKLWADIFMKKDMPGGLIVQWFQQTFPHAAEEMLRVWRDISGEVTELIEALGNAFGGGAGAAQDAGLSGTIDFAMTHIVRTISTALGTVLDLLTAAIKLISGDFSGAYGEITDISDRWYEDMQAEARANNTFMSGHYEQSGKAIADGFQRGWDKEAPHMLQNTEGLAERMVQQFEDDFGIRSPSTVTKEMGINIVKGFTGGISDWPAVSSMMSAARKLIGDALDAMKRVAGIRSPSTVMYGMGTNLVEGATLGIVDNTPTLAGAMGMMGDTMIGALTDSVSAGRSALDQMMIDLGNAVTSGSKLTLANLDALLKQARDKRDEMTQETRAAAAAASMIAPNSPALQKAIEKELTSGGIPTLNSVVGSMTNWTEGNNAPGGSTRVLYPGKEEWDAKNAIRTEISQVMSRELNRFDSGVTSAFIELSQSTLNQGTAGAELLEAAKMLMRYATLREGGVGGDTKWAFTIDRLDEGSLSQLLRSVKLIAAQT